MVKYKFKYWFEWGCSEDWCPCLWAADDVTGEKYGYSINLDELPISKELIHFLCELGVQHDEALDWDYPPDPLLWSKEEEKQFYQKAKEGYERLQEELGQEYEIIYCQEE